MRSLFKRMLSFFYFPDTHFLIRFFKKFFRLFFRLFAISLIILFFVVIFLYSVSLDLPSIETLQNYKPIQVAKIISADGKPLKDLYIDQKRDVVEIGKVPKDLRNALVFMEDRKFFEHPGSDIWGLMRAAVVNVSGGSIQGASTLTQQLARNMYNDIGFERSIMRKVKEFITASKIEQTYTKSEIMELYLNSVFFGHKAYGIQEASKYYFNKDVSQLNLNECAALVGLLPAPNRFSPKKNINTVVGHSKDFIDKMINQDFFIESKKEFTLTKVNGSLSEDEEISLSDILFLNDNYDTIPISYLDNNRKINSISHTYSKQKLLINIRTDEKIKYYRFKISGLNNMRVDGLGGGVADSLGFIEINNSSRALFRKNLVLKVLNEQSYISSEKRNLHTLLPIMVSNKNKKTYNIASYFIEDVKKELLSFRQSISSKSLEHLIPYYPLRSNDINSWIDKNYGMNLNFNDNQFNLYKDGLRVYSTIDTRIQNIVSNVFSNQMSINQVDLYNLYKNNPKKLDTVIMKSKNRKLKELKKYYSSNFLVSIKSNIVDQEIEKWTRLDKDESEIKELIALGLHRGERFIDENKNKKWDKAEKFTDALNGVYDLGEDFEDFGLDGCPDLLEDGMGGCLDEASKNKKNNIDPNNDNYSVENILGLENNGKYDYGEIFIDIKNNKWDIGEKWEDRNNNGKYDPAEKFFDGNKQYNLGERFTDKNNNEKYDEGEIFIDKKNGKYDPDGIIVRKINNEINRLAKRSLDSLNYRSTYILDTLLHPENILNPDKNIIIPQYLRKEFLVQGAVVVIDVKTGNIISMIGGRQEDVYFDFFNRSSQALRQPGSVFKPFVYMGGLKDYDSKHPFTAAYEISNSTIPIPLANGETWNPRNFDGKEDGLDMTLRQGLTESTNLVAAGLMVEMDNGPDSVKKIAQDFGITTSIYPGEALSLGATDVIPLEITSAYSAIANNGTYIKPNYINKIENSLGRVLMTSESDERFAEKQEGIVYIIRDMMKDVINYGTGDRIRFKDNNRLYDEGEYFEDFGFDRCPDRYEDGKGGCLWEWREMKKGRKRERGLKYNSQNNPDPNNDNYNNNNIFGLENNGKYDYGEPFSDKIGFDFQSPMAGKTGTTNKFTDAWFVGFTPQVAIGVWVGMDNPAISINKYGSKAAMPIFAYSIKEIYEYGKYSLGEDQIRELDKNLDWIVPDDIITLKICNKSRLIANKGCYSSFREFFLKESVPMDKCQIPRHVSKYK